MRRLAFGLLLASSLAAAGCATYSDDLVRAQRAYEGSEDERALAIFRILEPDTARLSGSEQAHYAYLRGMTDVRLGYKAEARHWLSLAASMEQKTPGSLPPEWAKHMTDSLKELNEEVYTAGIEALTNSPAASKAKTSGEPPPDDTAPPAASGDSDAPRRPKAKDPDGP